jgi:hypothetical protein
MKFSVNLTVILGLIASGTALHAQVIDFETLSDGGKPSDNMSLGLDDAYSVNGVNITMGFDQDGDNSTDTEAVFEQVGDADPDFGFGTCSGILDTADQKFESQLGEFFLRQPISGGEFGVFIIDYEGETKVTGASGEIWDIDGGSGLTERYTISAFDSEGHLLKAITSPQGKPDGENCGSTLDGRPWVFSFEGLEGGIARITIEFTGTKTSNIGLAFNNFNATQSGQPPEYVRLNPGHNGNWWRGEERMGEGVQSEIADAGDGSLLLVATIYSYDAFGNQIFLIAVGSVDGDRADVNVFITDNGVWGDAFDPELVEETKWGTGTFWSLGCDTMLMELIPNAEYQAMSFTSLLDYELIRLTSSLIPCPYEAQN